ncbi:MAG: hypothetical protein ACLUIQ_00280 [Dialister invisus]
METGYTVSVPLLLMKGKCSVLIHVPATILNVK